MTDSYELMLVEEEAVAEVQAMALRLLREQKLTQAKLADRMGVTPARVSQLFADEPENLTVKAAARLFYHLGERLVFTCSGIQKMDDRANADNARRAQALSRGYLSQEWKCYGMANDAQCGPVASMEAA